jgi:radical SAM protein with 4Fe4S-binding SPASM domain
MQWRSFYDRPLADELARYLRTAESAFRRKGVRGLLNAGRYLLERETKPEVITAQPSSAQIEPTKACNLKCVMCSNPFLSPEQKGHMPFEKFRELLDQLPYLSFLLLQGLGEILCHPRIMDFFREVRRRNIYYGFSTNGLLLDEEKARELVDIGVGWVNFSIDTHDPKRYEEIRGRDVLGKVLEHVRGFVRASEKVGHNPRIEIRSVYMRENLEDLPRMIELAYDVGVENLTAKEATSRRVVPDSGTRSEFYEQEQNRIAAIETEVKEKARSLGINLVWQSFSEFDPESCYLPWASAYVTYDGFVTPCSNLENPEDFNFGNAFEIPFLEIWNSPDYVSFRKNFFDIKKNRACVHHKECWEGFLQRSSSS